jgi:hypothetical protein
VADESLSRSDPSDADDAAGVILRTAQPIVRAITAFWAWSRFSASS